MGSDYLWPDGFEVSSLECVVYIVLFTKQRFGENDVLYLQCLSVRLSTNEMLILCEKEKKRKKEENDMDEFCENSEKKEWSSVKKGSANIHGHERYD